MISYDDALASLMAMFPDVDTDTINTVLRDHGGHMERTIDALLVLFAFFFFFPSQHTRAFALTPPPFLFPSSSFGSTGADNSR